MVNLSFLKVLRKGNIKVLAALLILIFFSFSGVFYKTYIDQSNKRKISDFQKVPKSSGTPTTIQWLQNPTFDTQIEPWYHEAEGDISDINAYISNDSANYEIRGEKRTFSLVETPPIGSNWVAVPNPDFPHGPSSNFTDSEGLKVYHEFDDHDANQNPSIHWDRNITMPVDMSDYVIKSASIQVVVNATVDLDVDCPGDTRVNDDDDPLDQQESYDYVRFYVLVSDLPKNIVYEMAYLQPTDLGQGNPPGDDTLPNSYLIPHFEDDLIYFLTSILSTDYFNFTITLGIRIYTADNSNTWDNDEFHELLIKSINLTLSYEKKIDQFTSVSWNQVSGRICDISKYSIEVQDAKLSFKYKIDHEWPDSSPNTELRIFINKVRIPETIKLIEYNCTPLFQDSKIGGFNIKSFILEEENISISVQLWLADEFELDQIIKISIDDIFLEISYIEYIPSENYSYLLLWTVIIILIIIVSILSALSLRYNLVIPRKMKKRTNLLLRTQKFKDIRNIQAIILIHRESGLPIFSRGYSQVMKGKKTLFSGFIQAVSIIGEEISSDDRKKKKKIKSTDKIDNSKIIELDLKQFFCLVLDIEELRTVLILKSRSSKRLKQIMFNFTLAFYLKISKKLENFDNDLTDYPAIVSPLLNEYFELYYKENFITDHHEKDIQNLKKKHKLSKIQVQIMNTVFSILSERRTFRLMDVLEKLNEKNEDLVIDAIETLIEHKIILPYDG